jgi:hypothetical protein
LPASRLAAQIWRTDNEDEHVEDRPAYGHMLNNGELDRCGITLLAGKAVGAAFVGAAAACLAVAEVLRLLQGGPVHEFVDLDLKFPEHRTAVLVQKDFSAQATRPQPVEPDPEHAIDGGEAETAGALATENVCWWRRAKTSSSRSARLLNQQTSN